MDNGVGTPKLYIACLQFFVAPTDLKGLNPKPELAPHVIGNSYGCPTSEGCTWDALLVAAQNVRKAGIFMSVSAGNSGSRCSSINDPPAIYESVFSVGALGLRTDTIATYSSRGPVTVDGSNRIKPNIAAPGSSVRSSVPPSSYSTFSGTSMASPAVAGAVALLWEAKSNLIRDVEKTERLFEKTATPLSSTTCGSTGFPNNVYGYGGVNVLAAVNS
eukprot:TRINITY_DN2288_c0_g1_i3.p1 TRINITY_DN2288_c0_g1~~TRINITY_DN2288_c0_g1_i3.p1  ORF type:complete len:217 (+),score=32.49 TRINITY_DN2288_c0_g1_i3:146-796(+)